MPDCTLFVGALLAETNGEQCTAMHGRQMEGKWPVPTERGVQFAQAKSTALIRPVIITDSMEQSP
jgi:hypothetical protein